jgi:hypothetical protein
MVDLRWQELAGVRARGGCDARELSVDAWGGIRGRGDGIVE